MERVILHVDVNNAFLSWSAIERLKNGETVDIRNIAAVIGGDEDRRAGIVLAKSNLAKKFGITTGETLYMARQKCPGLQVFKGDYKRYAYYSNELYKLLLQYTDKIERFSIDECFMDMTHYLMGRTILDIAKEINYKVKTELGFTVNIGISNNKLLAKMASDFEKPDKIHTLYPNEIPEKMWPLPVKELLFLGRKTAPKLYNMRIKTIGDLAHTDKEFLIKKFGKFGKQMWEYANGIDDSEVCASREKPKGIGMSTTLPVDISNIEKLEEVLLHITEQVCYRLRKEKMKAKVVNVQLRTKDFMDFSHQGKMMERTDSTKEIYAQAKRLLEEMYQTGTLIRLIGIRLDKLESAEEGQISIFEMQEDNKQKKLDFAIDAIKEQYGFKKISRASDINQKAERKQNI